MKTVYRNILRMSACFLLLLNLRAQSAEEHLIEGRAWLSSQRISLANQSFQQAVNLSPSNKDANILLAVTRVLEVVERNSFKTMLQNSGANSVTNSFNNFKISYPEDTEGAPIIANNYRSNEGEDFLVNELLPELQAAVSHLSVISDTQYELDMTPDETGFNAVTIDYGDIRMARALLRAVIVSIQIINSHETTFSVSDIADILKDDVHDLHFEKVLELYPTYLSQISTSALPSIQATLESAITDYVTASHIIRNRPISPKNYLFELDVEDHPREEKFRTYLLDVLDSFSGAKDIYPQELTPTVTLDLSRFFGGHIHWEQLYPQFVENYIRPNTLPDPTFNGLLPGMTLSRIEKNLAATIPSVNFNPWTQSFTEGQWIYLYTYTHGKPKPKTEWLKDGVVIQTVDRKSWSNLNKKLLLSDEGNYSVRVTNSMGTAESSIYLITVIPLNSLSSWRWNHFYTYESTGSADNLADADNDGVPNILEYALLGDPTRPHTAQLPILLPAGNTLTFKFLRARSDINYIVEQSSDLKTWTDISTNAGTVGQEVEISVPFNGGSKFLRLKVSE